MGPACPRRQRGSESWACRGGGRPGARPAAAGRGYFVYFLGLAFSRRRRRGALFFASLLELACQEGPGRRGHYFSEDLQWAYTGGVGAAGPLHVYVLGLAFNGRRRPGARFVDSVHGAAFHGRLVRQQPHLAWGRQPVCGPDKWLDCGPRWSLSRGDR